MAEIAEWPPGERTGGGLDRVYGARRSTTARRARGRRGWHPNVVVAMAAAIAVVLLAVFAYVLASSQARSRHDSEQRFLAQATIAASLTRAIFSASDAPASADAAKEYGTRSIDVRALAASARASHLAYSYIADSRGRVLAASPGAPASDAASSAALHEALGGTPWLSNLFRVGGRGPYLLGEAIPFSTRYGRRVEVLAYPASALGGFLSSYLVGAVPDRAAHALIVDGGGRIVASSVAGTAVGSLPSTPQFVRILAAAPAGAPAQGRYSIPSGRFKGERYVVAASIGGSAWRVGITEPTSALYPADVGSDWWVSWAVFAAFALAALCALVLLRRSLSGAQQIVTQAHTVEAVNAELEATNSELSAFSYSVSHDLRAPLRAIDGFSRIVLEEDGGALTDSQRRYLGLVRENTRTMGILIDDLLGFSRLANKALERAEVSTEGLVAEVEAELASTNPGHTITFVNGELPVVRADPALLRQVFVNLLGNAVKYSGGRGDDAKVTVNSEVENGERVFSVSDNGVGFDMRYADKLFKVFQRLHRVEEYEGTGVGLAIVQRIVTRHGGRIWADSKVNEGATFYFTLNEGAR